VASYAELRSEWLASGAKWHSRVIPTPPNWDPFAQLLQAGYLQPELTTQADTKNRD
jgi:hypothetical protein